MTIQETKVNGATGRRSGLLAPGLLSLMVLSAIVLSAAGCDRGSAGLPAGPATSTATSSPAASAVTSSAAAPGVAPSSAASTFPSAPASSAPLSTAPATDTGCGSSSTDSGPSSSARIVITKSERRLDLYSGDGIVGSYLIALGFAPKGDKEKEGDGRTPEGEFYVCAKNPESKFGPSLSVSYPSTEDAERGLRDGLITKEIHDLIVDAIAAGKAPPMKTALGGEICIHGGGTQNDWTQGCVGLEEDDMADLYQAVVVGTPISIRP